MRRAIVAGSFYPSDKAELIDVVRKYLVGKKEDVEGCVVPHAGYYFSGKLAGEVISKISEKKSFIILGVNHYGLGSKACFSFEDFSTPLGIAKNNKKLAKKILEKMRLLGFCEVNEESHEQEHSIEVLLPFLQLSQKKFDIVPIILKNLSLEECKEFAYILSKFLKKEVCVIVSSDFTHYGINYGFVPFRENVRENIYKLDGEIINKILNSNSEEVYEKASKSTVCGLYGITILREIATIMGWKGKLVDYYTSGDIVKDWNNVVGYAGIVFN